MKHIVTRYPEDTLYHDDMHDETVFIVGFPFWDVLSDNSRLHHFFGDFRMFNGVSLGEMNRVLSMLAPCLLELQRVIIRVRLDRDGFADMAWTDACLRKVTGEPVAQENLKGYCKICRRITEWEFIDNEEDQGGRFFFALRKCLGCHRVLRKFTKAYCKVCEEETSWKFVGYQRDEYGTILFALHNCVKCGATKDLGGER